MANNADPDKEKSDMVFTVCSDLSVPIIRFFRYLRVYDTQTLHMSLEQQLIT